MKFSKILLISTVLLGSQAFCIASDDTGVDFPTLFDAVKDNNLDETKRLIGSFDPDQLNQGRGIIFADNMDILEKSLVEAAIDNENLSMVELLLANGVTIPESLRDSEVEKLKSILLNAVMENNSFVAERLIALLDKEQLDQIKVLGFNDSMETVEKGLLETAIDNNNLPIIKLLLAKDVTVPDALRDNEVVQRAIMSDGSAAA